MTKNYHFIFFRVLLLFALIFTQADISAQTRHPKNQTSVETTQVFVSKGWNLLSLPIHVINTQKKFLFPTANSDAITYLNSYIPKDTLAPGIGYWLKFSESQTLDLIGAIQFPETISVKPRWNMIGSPHWNMPTGSIISNPGGNIVSSYYGYFPDSEYQTVDTLRPGFGYWVKATTAGTLIMMPPIPDTPTLVYPPDQEINQTFSITFLWSKVLYKTSYHLQVAEDSMFTTLVVNDSTLTDTLYSLSNLYNEMYYWRVHATNMTGSGEWTKKSIFSTTSLGLNNKYVSRLKLAEPYLYACAGTFGLWRKNIRQTNSQWESMGLDLTSTGHLGSVNDVIVDDTNPDRILAIYHNDLITYHQTYHSFDAGLHWSPADSDLILDSTYMEYCPFDRLLKINNIVLAAGAQAGIYSTTDMGNQWNFLGQRWTGSEHFSFVNHPIYTNILWAGGENNLFQADYKFSHDSGHSWTWAASLEFQWNFARVQSIALHPIDTNIAYFGVFYSAYIWRILKTSDFGQSWTTLLSGPRQPFGISSLLIDQSNPNLIWASYDKHIIRTTDAGSSWGGIEVPFSQRILDMVFDPIKNVMYIGTVNGIYVVPYD